MSISGKTRVVGVWGYPITHSLSPAMHNAALAELGLDWVYVPFSIDPGKIQSAVESIRALDLVGVNVTLPLKELVAPFLDYVDPVAAKTNSVNTIVNRQGVLSGYSTDGPGLEWDLADKGALPSAGSSVLVLGAGGSARSVIYSLAMSGFIVSVANRTADRAVKVANELNINVSVVDWRPDDLLGAVSSADLIINTTTLGMAKDGDVDLAVFPPGCFRSDQVLYDLVYTPPETGLMRLARSAGAAAYNGLGMLVRQGALSLQLWANLTTDRLPVSTMESALASRLS